MDLITLHEAIKDKIEFDAFWQNKVASMPSRIACLLITDPHRAYWDGFPCLTEMPWARLID
jgi:hypothetical protein